MKLLLKKFKNKLLILFFYNKKKFFDIFKLGLPKIKFYRQKLEFLKTNCQEKFINTILQTFHNKKRIIIDSVILYIYNKNIMTKKY